jgi:hypothetical protein
MQLLPSSKVRNNTNKYKAGIGQYDTAIACIDTCKATFTASDRLLNLPCREVRMDGFILCLKSIVMFEGHDLCILVVRDEGWLDSGIVSRVLLNISVYLRALTQRITR